MKRTADYKTSSIINVFTYFLDSLLYVSFLILQENHANAYDIEDNEPFTEFILFILKGSGLDLVAPGS